MPYTSSLQISFKARPQPVGVSNWRVPAKLQGGRGFTAMAA